MGWSRTVAEQSFLNTIWSQKRSWLWLTLSFTVGYYLLLLVSLIVRFGHLPNYVTFYNWPQNIWVIIQSTPSILDMLPIMNEEWLVEIGHMNYDFGHGISEWSLSLQPPKMFLVFIFSALIAANILMLRSMRTSCPTGTVSSASAATGLGAFLVALTNATMSWVVCCATPSWVVGLAMLGVGVSTSLWLEPLGLWLSFGGFGLLALTTIYLAGATTKSSSAKHPAYQVAGAIQK